MVKTPRLSKGLRRHIRQEKAAIRRQFGDSPESKQKISLLILKFHKSASTAKVATAGAPADTKIAPEVKAEKKAPKKKRPEKKS